MSIRNDEFLHRKQADGGGNVNGANPLAAKVEELEGRIGDLTDAIVAAGATGSVSAKLRRLTTDLDDLQGKIGLADSGVVAAGAIGNVSAKLRRLTTDLDENIQRIGATTDAVVDAGAVGSLAAKLRRLTTDLDVAKAKLGDLVNWIDGTDAVSAPNVTLSGTIALLDSGTHEDVAASATQALVQDLNVDGYTSLVIGLVLGGLAQGDEIRIGFYSIAPSRGVVNVAETVVVTFGTPGVLIELPVAATTLNRVVYTNTNKVTNVAYSIHGRV